MLPRPSPFEATETGVRIHVRVTPKSNRNRIEGLAGEADGGAALKVAVTAAPEGGKANVALVKLLAKAWRLPKTSISVVAGAATRRKTLFIEGEPGALISRLGAWLETTRG